MKIDKQNVADILALNKGQEGMLYHYLKEPDANLYNVQLVLRISGPLDTDHLGQAFNAVQAENEVLRSVFNWEQVKKPVQIILKNCPLTIGLHDFSASPEAAADIMVRQLLLDDRQRRFDLTSLPLRITVIRQTPMTSLLVITHHHMLYDGWSTGIFLKTFFRHYQDLQQQRPLLPEIKKSLKEVLPQHAARSASCLPFWRGYLEGNTPVTWEGNGIFTSGNHEVKKVRLSMDMSPLLAFATTRQVSRTAVIYTAFGLLLGRYFNTADVVFGSVNAGRDPEIDGLDQVMGNFINTLPFRFCAQEDQPLLTSVQDTAARLLDWNQHAHVSYPDVKQAIGASPADTLFDTVLVIENYPLDEQAIRAAGKVAVSLESVYENTDFPLLVTVYFKEQLEVELIYKSCFNETLVQQFGHHFLQMISSCMEHPELPANKVQPEENAALLAVRTAFNDTAFPLKETTVVALIDQHAALIPAQVAVTNGAQQLTYRDLQEQATQWAAFLQQTYAVGPGDLVGLMLSREICLLPAILGILKTGAAFVPIDPSAPLQRISVIVQQAGLMAMISKQRFPVDVINGIPLIGPEDIQAGEFRPVALLPDSTAYVIHTSGSTGTPKGVMITHHSLLNYISWCADTYLPGNDLVFPLYSSLAFDLTITTLFLPLISGNQILLVEQDDPLAAVQTVFRHTGIDVIKLTPSHLRLMLEQVTPEDAVTGRLKVLIVGGEQLDSRIAGAVHDLFKGKVNIYNEYGPTEATVGCMIYRFNPEDRTAAVPIGKPIYNTRIYLLDAKLQPVIPGLKGELFISGTGVAAGYVNNAAMTASKFLPDPFVAGAMMYRTGDTGRMLPDGNFAFIGRTDDQMKLRGFRIEPGEIVHHVNRHADIRESVVVLQETYLVCYYSGVAGVDEAELRAGLQAVLPAYMVPQYFVWMSSLPLNVNGKVDRKQLPPVSVRRSRGGAVASNAAEQLLCNIWAQVLGMEEVSIDDHFFTAGGDSIKSIQLSARLRQAGFELSVKELFRYPTVREQAVHMRPLRHVADQSPVTGEVVPGPVQRWLLRQGGQELHHFNQSVLLEFPAGISEAWVRLIFGRLQEHHDALRLVLRQQGTDYRLYNEGTAMALSLETVTGPEEMEAVAQRVQRSIDLAHGPLMKVVLFQGDVNSRVLIVIHHLAIDGVSWRILFEDIDQLYRQLQQGAALQLPKKTDAYQRWTNSLENYINSARYKAAVAYWSALPTGRGEVLRRDFPAGSHLMSDSRTVSWEMSEAATRQLLGSAHEAFGTNVPDLLLSALSGSIQSYMGLEEVLIALEGHGREELNETPDISRTVGWFTSIYPVLLQYQGNNPGTQVKWTKEKLRQLPNNGVDYLLWENAQERPVHRPAITFNYLGQFDSDTADTAFNIATGPTGDDVSLQLLQPYDWNLIGAVRNGRLQLTLQYSITQYHTATVAGLLETYGKQLLQITAYCSNYGKKELTPSDLTCKTLDMAQVAALQEQYDVEDVYTLSPMQEGLLYHALLTPDSGHYLEQKNIRISGDMDPVATELALDRLAARYASLRTLFLHRGFDQPVQVVLKERKPAFSYQDIREKCTGDEKELIIKSYRQQDAARMFDLEKDPLMRMIMLRTAEKEYELIWSHHHIIMDGWCMDIIWKDFLSFYTALSRPAEMPLPPETPYARYIGWLGTKDKAAMARYWKTCLADYDRPVQLPAAENSTAATDTKAAAVLHIDSTLTSALKNISEKYALSLNTVVQTAWGILLTKYNDTDDVVFGNVVSGRSPEIPDIGSMVGLFVNTIPVRMRVAQQQTAAEVMAGMQQQALESEQHQYLTLQEIQHAGPLGNQLFNHILAFENYPISDALAQGTEQGRRDGDFAISGIEVGGSTHYDLVVLIFATDTIRIQIDYNPACYDAGMTAQLLQHLKNILIALAADPEVQIGNIEMMTAAELEKINESLNREAVGFPQDLTVIGCFENQVNSTPHNIAISYEGTNITYAALNSRANALAALLRSNGAVPGGIVALLTSRTIDTVAGMLAIMKTGNTYLPVDTDYPTERIAYMISDSGASLLLTDLQQLPESIARLPVVRMEQADGMDDTPVPCEVLPENVCYVIYTSGTTGNPKGVMVTHRNVVRLLMNDAFQFGFDAGDVWTMFHSHCFDFSVWEIYGALLRGGRLVIIPKPVTRDPHTFLRILQAEAVTVLNMTPSAFYSLIHAEEATSSIRLALRYVIFGGEALSPGKLTTWSKKHPDVKLINMYGITETTVHVTYKEIGISEMLENVSNIGKPIPTLSVRLLDRHMKPVPVGATGEIYVGGSGVSNGYLGKPELTAGRFVTLPGSTGAICYRSGDLGRLLQTGEIVFLGRADHQVQVRGFRIEPGEIEGQLLTSGLVKEAVVQVLDEADGPVLAAYYIPLENASPAALREELKNRLPAHMVPAHFISMDFFPLTANGKLDTAKLPRPSHTRDSSYVKPKTELQHELVKIWAAVLNTEEQEIGIDSNFFDIGGNSISAIRLAENINRHFRTSLSITKIFRHPMVSSQAALLADENGHHAASQQEEMETGIGQMNETLNLLNNIE